MSAFRINAAGDRLRASAGGSLATDALRSGTGALQPSLSFSSSSQKRIATGSGTLALTAGFAAAGRETDLAAATLPLTATPSASGTRKVATTQTATGGTLGYSRSGTKSVATAGTIAATPTPAWTGLKKASTTGSIALTATLSHVGGPQPRTSVATLALTATLTSAPTVVFDPGVFDPGTFDEANSKAGFGAGSLAVPPVLTPVSLPKRSGAGGVAAASPAFAPSGVRQVSGSGAAAASATVGNVAGRKVGVAAGTLALAATLPGAGRLTASSAGGTIACTLSLTAHGSAHAALSLLLSVSGVGLRKAAASGATSAAATPAALGLRKAVASGAAPIVVNLAALGLAKAAGSGSAPLPVTATTGGVFDPGGFDPGLFDEVNHKTGRGAGSATAGPPGLAVESSAEFSGAGGLALTAVPVPASQAFLTLVLGLAAGGSAAFVTGGGDLRAGNLSLSTSGEAVSEPGAGSVAIVVDLATLGLGSRAGPGTLGLGAVLAASGHDDSLVDIPPGIPLRGVLRRAIALRGRLPDPVRLTGVLSNQRVR